MSLSKEWLNEQIEFWNKRKSSTFDSIEIARISGIVSGLKIAYDELVKPPVKGIKTEKKPNIEKGYEAIIQYYMNNADFIKLYPDEKIRMEKANAIAITKMDEQQKRLQ